MTGAGRHIRKTALALALFAASCPVAAADLSMADLLGRWCGDPVNYTFAPGQLLVTPLHGQALAHGNISKISQIEGASDHVDVFWAPYDPSRFTRFRFSSDKSQLIQMEETEGDKGPRRIFRRCR
jgi:hypothetical protein